LLLHSQIFLFTSTGNIVLGNNKSTGVVINIGDPSAIGLNPEDEFTLGIHVIDTGNDFFRAAATATLTVLFTPRSTMVSIKPLSSVLKICLAVAISITTMP
jgi:hypothetical protein